METNQPKKNYTSKVWIVKSLIFAVIFIFLFINLSYLFRPIQINRTNIVGLAAEPKNSIDMLYIGGSSTFVYWAPMQAWEEEGITSYNFAGNTMSPALLKPMLQEGLKVQDPKLIVIDLRAFPRRDAIPYEEENIRSFTDFLPYSLNRAKAIEKAISLGEANKKNRLQLHLDLVTYHGNWKNISKEQFQYADNQFTSYSRGFYLVPETVKQPLPTVSNLSEKETLSEETNLLLLELLDYCKTLDKEFLFIVNPYVLDEKSQKQYNYIGSIVEEYGIQYLNTNYYYDEKGLDFTP
ncbi:hypothetical protein, partial [Akkermansia muciniphila]|uniref:hypothetical protein n=1 Tax=Akkermansia muciniphila TaxID=239935 RepID=UPI00122F82DF